jgi:hypothetical protein
MPNAGLHKTEHLALELLLGRYEIVDESGRERYAEFTRIERAGWVLEYDYEYTFGVVGFPAAGSNISDNPETVLNWIENVKTRGYKKVESASIRTENNKATKKKANFHDWLRS